VLERDEEVEKNKNLGANIEQLQKELAHERLSKAEEVRILEQTMKEENERLLESNKVLKASPGDVLVHAFYLYPLDAPPGNTPNGSATATATRHTERHVRGSAAKKFGQCFF